MGEMRKNNNIIEFAKQTSMMHFSNDDNDAHDMDTRLGHTNLSKK